MTDERVEEIRQRFEGGFYDDWPVGRSQIRDLLAALAQAERERDEAKQSPQVLGDWPPSASRDAIVLARAEMEEEGWLSPQLVEERWPGLKKWAARRIAKERDAAQAEVAEDNAEIANLRAEVERLKADLKVADEYAHQMVSRWNKAEAALARVRAALKRYGVHDKECAWVWQDHECTCGLVTAEAILEGRG